MHVLLRIVETYAQCMRVCVWCVLYARRRGRPEPARLFVKQPIGIDGWLRTMHVAHTASYIHIYLDKR